MFRIKVRQGVGGTKYQVVILLPDKTINSRTFRRISDARAWASSEDRKVKATNRIAGAK